MRRFFDTHSHPRVIALRNLKRIEGLSIRSYAKAHEALVHEELDVYHHHFGRGEALRASARELRRQLT